MRRLVTAFALCAPIALAAAATALVITSGDGTGNTTAPSPDPGWSNVGTRYGAFGAVYLGNGWVLTAHHVSAGDTNFGGTLYPMVPGSNVQLSNPDSSLADLDLYHLYPPYPPLPALTISSTPPATATELILIGYGCLRGDPTTWNPAGPGPTYDGFLWGAAGTMRWGTNTVQLVPELPLFETALGTQLFATVFDESGPLHTPHEAQGASGDSGGAVFAWNGSSYELAGILVGIAGYEDQPPQTALYGNYTLPADLSVYRDEIITTMPEPSGALWAGAALAAALARLSAGTRRACRGTGCAASSPRRA
jgi:hypothetical protein